MTHWAREPWPVRRSVDDLLVQAQERIAPRLNPGDAHHATADGALLVDLRSQDERRRHGVVPGSLHIPRLVLEWRVDPDSGYTNPHIASLDCRLVLFCAQGFASSFAAASLRELGCSRATDMVGGFEAWKAAGLPVRPLDDDRDRGREELPGMGGPEPFV
jgi:rhodanese-related sulfurtransferase